MSGHFSLSQYNVIGSITWSATVFKQRMNDHVINYKYDHVKNL